MAAGKTASGFRDFFGPQASAREELVSKITKAYRAYGYEPLYTPAVEKLDSLLGSGGQENEKLIFKILKRGDKFSKAVDSSSRSEDDFADLGLRFDMTVPLCRVFSQYQNEIKLPWKVFHIGPVWRAERPQQGRYREFFQCDIDIVGSSSEAAEVDILQTVFSAIDALGFKDLYLEFNHRALIDAIANHYGLSDRISEFAILLDKQDKLDRDTFSAEMLKLAGQESAPKLLELFETPNLDEFFRFDEEAVRALKAITSHLRASGFKESQLRFSPSLARGMGYYTGAVFEIRSPHFDFALGGGGRYDNLIGRFSKKSVPAVGISLGFERLCLALEGELSAEDQLGIFVPVLDESLRPKLYQLVAELKTSLPEHRFFIYPDQAKLKKQFQFADNGSFKWCLVAGEDEFAKGQFGLKNLKQRSEQVFSSKEMVEALKS